jgi:hypothetical protein
MSGLSVEEETVLNDILSSHRSTCQRRHNSGRGLEETHDGDQGVTILCCYAHTKMRMRGSAT